MPKYKIVVTGSDRIDYTEEYIVSARTPKSAAKKVTDESVEPEEYNVHSAIELSREITTIELVE